MAANDQFGSLFGAFKQFTEEQKIKVWQKGFPAPGRSLADYRLDACGALIAWDKYGDTTPNGTGWEIDHIIPVSAGGTDHIDNLQPLQWQNNRAKGDSPVLACLVKAVAS